MEGVRQLDQVVPTFRVRLPFFGKGTDSILVDSLLPVLALIINIIQCLRVRSSLFPSDNFFYLRWDIDVKK